VLFGAILLSGCARTDPVREADLEGATRKDSMAVRKGAVYTGMRERFVYEALGLPDEVNAAGREKRLKYEFRRCEGLDMECRTTTATVIIRVGLVEETGGLPDRRVLSGR